MRSSPLPTLIALLACILAAWSLSQSTGPATTEGSEKSPQPLSEAQGSDGRVAELERRIAALENRPATGQPADSTREPAPPQTDWAPRIQQLEQRLTRLEARAEKVIEPFEEAQKRLLARRETEAASLPELRARATDPSLSAEERLQALRQLRSNRSKNARSGEVAQAMVLLAQTSPDPKVRADVWRQMSGADDPYLIPHLIQALRTDVDAKVREEAAETLGDFRDRPEARAALEHAKQFDKHDDVREQALRSLGRGRR